MKRERERYKIRSVRTENTGRHEKKDMANVICVHIVGRAEKNMQRAKISDKKACELHVDVGEISTNPLLDIKFKVVEI
jgi:hypothetical protein